MKQQELANRIKIKDAPVVLDVRTGMEFNSGHIPGAIHAPSMKILFHLAKLPEDKNAEIVLTCEHGPRAQLAKMLISTFGYRNVKLLEGHMSSWRGSKLPVEKLV